VSDEVKDLISSNRITEIIKDSLFRDEEVENNKPKFEFVVAEGVMRSMGFHKERLGSHRDEVKEILSNLPREFQPTEKEGGCGGSFLSMCMDKNGRQWGEHPNVEELCLLAIALDLGNFPIPREGWIILPGNMPYFSIKN